jgi:hypothetical protein
MKQLVKVSLTVLLAAVLFSCAKKEEGSQTASVTKDSAGNTTTTAPVAAGKGKYAMKSGIFVMKTNMMGEDMITTTYFDDYGKKECQEMKMEMKMAGQTIKTNNVTITNGDGFRYTIDMEKKTGTKTKDYGGNSNPTADMASASAEKMKEYGIKKESPVTILGKTCDVYSMDGKMGKGTFATWQGISMRSEMSMAGMKTPMKIETTSIEENAAVPASKFEVPKDVTITAY